MKRNDESCKQKPENIFFGNVAIYFFEFDVNINKYDCK